MVKRQHIDITGTVQGIGFRPAVYNISAGLGLTGFVYNDTKGLSIEVQGDEERIKEFLEAFKSGSACPAMAKIKNIAIAEIPLVFDETEFVIKESKTAGDVLSEVAPDIALCYDCLKELNNAEDYRSNYPFINCTNCGPRYSIIKSIPYDRANTTMSEFSMCETCHRQYTDITDRRFHAQPVACGRCGPKIWLTDSKGSILTDDRNETITAAAQMLRNGKIVAIKGIGGFHLAVDALNEKAVKTLRQRKQRESKPFAMMASSIEKIKRYAEVSAQAEQLLKSPASPIVLLPKKEPCAISPAAAEGLTALGFMLCYAPLHYLIFDQNIDVLVMTSANISDEPLICDNALALERLGNIADAFLMHDRDIYRQIDDSVFHIIDGTPVSLRRARGYVPTPIELELNSSVDIFAAGADMKNTFCFVKQNRFICSEHIGDLADGRVYHHYIKSIEHLAGLFEVRPEIIACDTHPGYFSTQYAQSKKAEKIFYIQHHWAHAASVLAENNIQEPVISLVCDGTGYGTDGAIWGCECLIASLEKFERFAHLAYFPLPGGDKASKEAIRPLIGLLAGNFNLSELTAILKIIEPDIQKITVIAEQIEKKINTVETSSLGRVFDAVAALAGIGNYNSFDAELPMKLEACIMENINESYDFDIIEKADEPLQLDLSPMLGSIIMDRAANLPVGVISAKFHNTLAEALVEVTVKARKATGLNTAATSGGVFCNKYLAEKTIKLLKNKDFKVLFNAEVPSNDGGLSLGQAAIAAAVAGKNIIY
ncbi:MAG: carbamoyltransferase HypF [Phycisphaerae bacterium]|nr:carbamoyltransferase HypF [Phycisphaerae bacterium]